MEFMPFSRIGGSCDADVPLCVLNSCATRSLASDPGGTLFTSSVDTPMLLQLATVLN
jgi:hypothetical protein